MYTIPTNVAVRSEIKAPMYIDLQTVRKADGLTRFQAMALSSSCWSSCVSLSSSTEHALITFTSRLLDARLSQLVASLSLYSW